MPDTAYKLTDENMRTHGGCQWKLGEWKETSGEGDMCGEGWIHLYDDPLVAVFLNPIHAEFKKFRLFEAECEGKRLDDRGLKHGRTRVRLVKELPVPQMSTAQRVRAAILCAWEVCEDKAWRAWARGWLDGADRGSTAALWSTWAAGLAASWVAKAGESAVLVTVTESGEARAERTGQSVAWATMATATMERAAAAGAAETMASRSAARSAWSSASASVTESGEARAEAAGAAAQQAAWAAVMDSVVDADVEVAAAGVAAESASRSPAAASEAAPLDLPAILRRAIAEENKLQQEGASDA